MDESIEQLVARTREHVLANIDQFLPYDRPEGWQRYSWGRYYISFNAHVGAVISVWASPETITIPNPRGAEVFAYLEGREKRIRLERSRAALLAGLSETSPRPGLWERIKERFA